MGVKIAEKKTNKKKKQALALPIDSMLTILSISAFATVFISVVESRVWQRVVVD